MNQVRDGKFSFLANDNSYDHITDSILKNDIELVMHEANCSRHDAARALDKTKGDIVGAILSFERP